MNLAAPYLQLESFDLQLEHKAELQLTRKAVYADLQVRSVFRPDAVLGEMYHECFVWGISLDVQVSAKDGGLIPGSDQHFLQIHIKKLVEVILGIPGEPGRSTAGLLRP
jgi:hypothetical protein